MCDDLREGQSSGFGVEATFGDFEIRCDGAQVVVGGFVCEIAQAEGLPDFAGGQEFFELSIPIIISIYSASLGFEREANLCGYIQSSVWNVQVANDENQSRSHDDVRGIRLAFGSSVAYHARL